MSNQGEGKVERMSVSESHLSLVRSTASKVTVTTLAAPYWYGKLNGFPMLTPRSRGKDKVLLNRISLLWNTETPYESYSLGKPTARKAEPSCGNRMFKKQMPADRKVREIHNPLDRAANAEIPNPKGCPHEQMVSLREILRVTS